MELKIVETEFVNGKGKLHLAFGITDERSDELCQQMEDYLRMIMKAPYSRRNAIVYRDLAKMCNTNEELVYITVAHCKFLHIYNLPF